VVNSVVVGMVGTSFLRCTSWDRLEGPARCSVAENPTPAMRAHQGWTIRLDDLAIPVASRAEPVCLPSRAQLCRRHLFLSFSWLISRQCSPPAAPP
jgi:hypothetical protein